MIPEDILVYAPPRWRVEVVGRTSQGPAYAVIDPIGRVPAVFAHLHDAGTYAHWRAR